MSNSLARRIQLGEDSALELESVHFAGDRVPDEALTGCEDSLRFIHVSRLDLQVFAPGEAFGNSKRRVQGRFQHAGTCYWLWVTDPICEREYLARLGGGHVIENCFLTISLGERYGDACHKLIAAVIKFPR